MHPSSQHLNYRAYILRLWQERSGSSDRPAVWRYSLEDTRTRQRRGFASLDDLVAYLQVHAGEIVEPSEVPNNPES